MPNANAEGPQSQPLVLISGAPVPGPSDNFASNVTAIASLLWPLLAIAIVLFFQRQWRSLLAMLVERIGDRETEWKIGPFELKRQVMSMRSEIESLTVDKQVLAAPSLLEGDMSKALERLADAYMTNATPDKTERLRVKEELIARMAKLIIDNHVSRKELATNANEGMRGALATAIHSAPAGGDDSLLLRAGAGIKRLHVRYRFMMAVSRLAQLGLIAPEHIKDFEKLAVGYRDGADHALRNRIERTRLVLRQLDGGGLNAA